MGIEGLEVNDAICVSVKDAFTRVWILIVKFPLKW